MRRLGLLILCLGASGCGQYASSPFDGFAGFIGDTHTINRGPNAPIGDSENMRRVRGLGPEAEPLVPQSGNVWPGPGKAEPTLNDIIKETPQLPSGAEMKLPGVRGSSTPPGPVTPAPAASPVLSAPPTPPAQPAPAIKTLQTPQGPATVSGGPGVQTYTSPTGTTGLLVPNGNGTSTLIAPDGSVQTVPTPK